MTIYNMTFTNSGSPTDTLIGINNATGGILGVLICIIIYFILIKSANDNDNSIANTLLFSSFILSVISAILLGLSLLPDYVLGINITILAASIFVKLLGEK